MRSTAERLINSSRTGAARTPHVEKPADLESAPRLKTGFLRRVGAVVRATSPRAGTHRSALAPSFPPTR